MSSDLDLLLRRLREAQAEPRLAQLEPAVWARIDRLGRDTFREAWSWRAAIAALMLMTGALASGAAAAPARENSPFSVSPAFAPSTLLEDGR
ncbi:MAG: hypothetical protein HY054_04385 [Proteobacteria bacterium]|nr:hypothetical protein [Pseudomonadota bacterium]